MTREKTNEEATHAELDTLRRRAALMDATTRVLQETLSCESVREIAEVCLGAAERLTGSQFGFIGRINAVGTFDTDAISNPGWAACEMTREEAEKAICNMPIRGLDRNTMRDGTTRVVNDPASHPDSKGTPEGHVDITCFLGVPLKRADRVVGMIGLANKDGGYTDGDRDDIEELAVVLAEAFHRKEIDAIVAAQAKDLLEVSTPILQVRDGVVVAPIIGTLDSERATRFTEQLLETIVSTRSETAIIDITGVPAVDMQTARSLLETIEAARMLGAFVVLTGISPAIAQTLVQLGADLGDVATQATLSAGLDLALSRKGLEVRRRGEP